MRLLISGGASGGHVSAALAVADAFSNRDPDGDVLLVGRTGGVEEALVPDAGFPLTTIRVSGWNRDVRWSNLRLPAILPPALEDGVRVVDCFQPDVALGVGAYAMVPCLWAARRRGIPYVLQVSEPGGLAHQMLRSGAAAACVSFAEDAACFPTRRTVFTGYPIRPGFLRAVPRVPPRRLLVMGGSLGARRLNQVVWGALDGLLQRFDEVVHLTGGQGEREALRLVRHGYRPISTSTDVPSLMAAADLVLSRAGLGTCAELTAAGLPAILVPGTFGGGHQEHNAAKLVAAGAATRLADAELTVDRLLQQLQELDPTRLRRMARASAAMGRFDAAARIVDVLEEVAASARARMPAGRVRVSMSVLAGAGAYLRPSGPAVRRERRVEDLFGQVTQAPELFAHLAQELGTEVVGPMEGVASRT